MTRTLDKARGILSPKSVSGGPLGGFRNKIINGDFDIWQRGTSQTGNSFGSADRWDCFNAITTKTASQQAFTLGQTDVPGNPKYYMRNVVTSASDASSNTGLVQRIEGCETLAGKEITITFYGKADASKFVGVEVYRNYGTGGSPSTGESISAEKIALTTEWARYDVKLTLPDISSKTLGSDNNDSVQVVFWFDAGSAYDARSDTLGNQSGTFDVARISLVEGDATLEDDPFEPRHYQQELELCMRYFENGEYNIFGVNYVTNAASFYNSTQFKVRKRATPTISISAGTSFLFGGISTNQISVSQFSHYAQGTTTAAGTGYYAMSGWSADAEL